jgi:hypothetical protein
MAGRVGALVVVVVAMSGCGDKDTTFACPVPDGSTMEPTMCPRGSMCCPVGYRGAFACSSGDEPCPTYCTEDPNGRTCPWNMLCSSEATIGCVADCPIRQQCGPLSATLCCPDGFWCVSGSCYAPNQVDGGTD